VINGVVTGAHQVPLELYGLRDLDKNVPIASIVKQTMEAADRFDEPQLIHYIIA